MGDFLIWASGVDADFLRRFPTERTKFIGLGGAVLTTSTLATLSCTLTLSMVLGVVLPVAAIFGVLWGTAIFNLDRWLIASVRRQDHWYQTLAMFLPRLALAVLIGTVIAEPLVLRVFQSEIDAEIPVLARERNASFEQTLNHDPRFAAIPTNEARITSLQGVVASNIDDAQVVNNPEIQQLTADVATKQQAYAAAEQAVVCEHEGTCGSGVVGAGPAWQEKVDIRDRAAAELADAQARLDTRRQEVRTALGGTLQQQHADAAAELSALQTETDALKTERQQRVAEFTATNNADRGLLTRMEALSRLTERRPTLNVAVWTLRLFVIALDSLAVLVKFLMSLAKPSLYDRVLADYEEHEAQDNHAEFDNDSQARQLRSTLVLDEAQLNHQHELAALDNVAKHMADRQEALGIKIVDLWYDRQLQAIDDDPDAFLTTN